MSSTQSRTGLLGAAVAGAVAYGLGYLFTYALSISVVRESTVAQLAESFGDGGAAWKMVGWVFYNAHGVTTTLDVDVPVFGGTSAVNLVAQSDGLSVLLYAIPPALLVAAGLAAARAAGANDVGDALRVGPAVALGYLPLALVGTVVFTVTVGSSVGEPTAVSAVGLAGIVYPVAFGTLGATAGAAFSGDEVVREAPA